MARPEKKTFDLSTLKPIHELTVYTKYDRKVLISVLITKSNGLFELTRYKFNENGRAQMWRLGIVRIIGKVLANKTPTLILETGMSLQMSQLSGSDQTQFSSGEIYDMILSNIGETAASITLDSTDKSPGTKKRGRSGKDTRYNI